MERAKKRLDHEYKSFPLDYIKVNFKKETVLEWHFLFIGQKGTPFEGGEYHGTLIFPESYPFSPPSTQIITPNGRFQTNERVCFSISDFHPENWKPAYTMSSFLLGVYSFMMTEATDTVGSLERNESEIRELAEKSKEFNFQDGSAELFQNEIKVALIENSDTDPIPLQSNEPDISSQKSQSCYSPDMFESDVSSKEAQPNETTDTVENSGIDKNSETGLAIKSREYGEKVGALIDIFESQSDNVNSPSIEKTKHTTSLQSKQSLVITQPSTQTVDQFSLLDHVIVNNSTVTSDSTSDPSQQSGSNNFSNSKEKREDNVASTSEPVEDRKHLPTDTVWILDMDEDEMKSLVRMSKEFVKNDESLNKMFKEEIDETIGSSFISFPANNVREHILCDAKHYHQLNTIKSLHKTTEPPSHLEKVDKEEMIGQASFSPGNTSHYTSNCTSSYVRSKENHSSKLLERTLPEGSKPIHSHNSATYVSEHSERPDNISAAVDNIAIDNYNRDTSDISKPNEEFASKRSNDSLSKKTESDRSLNSSKKCSSRRSKSKVRNKKNKYSYIGKYTFLKISSQIPRPNQDNTADKLIAHPSGGFEYDPSPKVDRSPESLVSDTKRGITNLTDNLHEFHSQISRHNLGNIMDKEGIHLPRNSEKSTVREFDHTPHSLVDQNPHSIFWHSLTPPTILQVHNENPFQIQTFKTSSDRIVPKKTNSELQDSDISNSTKNKSPENTSHKKTSESSRSYPPISSFKSKSSQHSNRSALNRPLSYLPNSLTRGKSLQNMSVKRTNERLPSNLHYPSVRNRPSQNTRDDRSLISSLSSSLNRSHDHVITDTLYVPPEITEKNPISKSDLAPLSFAGNQRVIIFDASNELSSQISRPNQINTIDERIAKPSGRSENGSVSNSNRVPNYLAGNEGRIKVPLDYLEGFSSEMPHPRQSKTIDKRVAHPPMKSENSLVCNFDQVPHSSYGKKNDSTSDFPKQLESNVVVDSVSDLNSGQFLPLTTISNARPGKDYNLDREMDPFHSNLLHSDNPRKVFHSTPFKVPPEVHYEDPFAIKTNQTSSGYIPRDTVINTELHNFDISDYSIYNNSTPNLSVRKSFQNLPPYPLHSSIRGNSLVNLSGKQKDRPPSHPPNSSIINRSPVSSSDVTKTKERTPSYLANSSNKSLINASAKRMNERVHPPNSLNKAFQNTNVNESIDKSPSHSITSSSIPQDHGKTKKHILLPDGSSSILRSNNHRDLKYTCPIKSDHDPSSATTRSYDGKLKLFSISRSKSADKSSRHTLPIENSHYSSFTTNNHDHDDISRSDDQSFSLEKVKCPKSFNAKLPTKEKTGMNMNASKYTTLTSQRFETHLKLLETKSYSNSLLSRNADRIKHQSLLGFGSDCNF